MSTSKFIPLLDITESQHPYDFRYMACIRIANNMINELKASPECSFSEVQLQLLFDRISDALVCTPDSDLLSLLPGGE